MEFQAFILSLLLLTIVSQTESRSLDTTVQCATTCTESNTYRQGYTYNFRYEATVASFVDDIDGPYSTKIQISADTQVSVLSPCEMVLMVERASIRDPSRTMDTADWIDHMTRNPLHFSWQDGRIPDVCASNDDPIWVVNVKRAMLSTMLFPSSAQAGSEPVILSMTDVTGECEWEYDVSETDGSTTSRATKDYSKCRDRNQQLLLSHFNKYYGDSEQQNFIKSSQECVQNIFQGRVRTTECEENHLFVPFSKDESGVRTKISQISTEGSVYRSYSPRTLLDGDTRRTSIVFEPEKQSFSSSDISEVQSLIQDLCVTLGTEHYTEVGEDFIKMVFLLRRLDATALGQVYSSLDGACPVYEDELRFMFQDALQWCGSEGCVVYAARMIESGELSDKTAARWLTSMSLISEPTVPMVKALAGVVRVGRLPEKSYLTMGTMINRLAAINRNCMSDPEVIVELKMLERKLGANCRTSNPDMKQEILHVLRAIGNAGHFPTPSILAECAGEISNDMETRIAAVQAFRRMACNTDRSALKRILTNSDEDAEIRIGSYMALMQCPTPALIKEVVQMLDREPIQQVASFISTHFEQLLESTDPLKGYIKPLLIETEFARKYDLDPRKFSRFYESTLFSETLNAGATVESSVVWSPKSFVPRSGSVDMTLDVFGQAVNLFELGGRVEGVETLIQSYLGPKGFLKNNRFSNLFTGDVEDDGEEADEDEEEVDEEPEVISRSTRSSSDARLRQIKQQHEGRVPTENKPSASWYLRLFGNEMYYKNTYGMTVPAAESNSINIGNILNGLAKGKSFKHHDDMMLMNSAFVIPTIAGLPLTVAFNGTASIDVTANGRFDMTGLFASPPALNVLGSIQPRGVVLVTGSMSVDAHVTRTGIATESTAFTSWTLGGKLSVENGRSLTVKVDAPNQRNTAFRFNHKLLKIVGDDKVDARNGLLGLAQTENNCPTEFAGQRICISNSMSRYPDGEVGSYVLPTAGPLEIDIYLQKTDNGFDHYILNASYSTTYSQTSDIPTQMAVEVVMDTPGSTVNRRSLLDVRYNGDEMWFVVGLEQPDNRVRLRGNIDSDLTRKTATLQYRRNGVTTGLTATYEKQVEESETRWDLRTVLVTPARTVNGNAFLSLDPTRHVLVNVSIPDLMIEPIAFNLALRDNSGSQRNRLIYKGSGSLMIPDIINSGVSFDMKIKPRSDAFSFTLNYVFSGQEEERIVFMHKRSALSTGSTTTWEATQKFVFSQYPLLNHHVQCNYTNGRDMIASYVMLEYGRHATHDDNNEYLSLSQSFSKSDSGDTKSMSGSVGLSMPPFQLDYSAGVQVSYTDHSLNTSLNVGDRQMRMRLDDSSRVTGLLDMTMGTEFPTPWGQIHLNERLLETQKNMYHLASQLNVGATDHMSFQSDVYLVNLDDRKLFETRVRGPENGMILHQKSVFEFLAPSGFHTQHTFDSQSSNLVNVTIRHQAQEGMNFETNVIAIHEPSKHYHFKLDFDDEETSTQLARIEYQDESAIMRFVELAASRSSVPTNTGVVYTGSLEFTTDVPPMRVNSVVVQVSAELSSDSKTANGNVMVDGAELFGAEVSHTYTVRVANSGLNTVGITVRQGINDNAPSKMAVSASMESTLDNGPTVSLNYRQNDVDKLSTRFQVNPVSMTVTGQASQDFSEDFPTDMNYNAQKLTNGVNMRLVVDRREAVMTITKSSESSVSLSWTQDISVLNAAEVPSSIESTLSWGEEPSSRGTGAWLTAMVNGVEEFDAKALYHPENTRVTFSVHHNVRTLQESVPQIEAIASQEIAPERGHILARIRVNSNEILFKELTWSQSQIQLQARHALLMLDDYKVPRVMNLQMTKTGSIGDGSATIVTDVAQIHSQLTLISNPTSASATYTSNDDDVGADISLVVNWPFPDASFTFAFSRNEDKSADITARYDHSRNHVNLNWNQNLYLDENYPLIPNQGRVMFEYTLGDKAFSVNTQATYNDYSTNFNFELSYPFSKKRASLSMATSLSQNILPQFSRFHSTTTGRITYGSEASVVLKYTINEKPERMTKLRLTYDDGNESGTGFATATAHFTHNQPRKAVPRNIITVVTITPLEYSYKVALSVTTNDDVQRIGLIGGFNPDGNTVTVGYAQDIPMLNNWNVPRNVTLTAGGDVVQNTAGHTFNGDAKLQINEDVYSAGAMVGYVLGDGEITVTSDLRHEIKSLLAFSVPKRIRKVTTINYGVLDSSSWPDVNIQVTSDIDQTVYDAETDSDLNLHNEVRAGANIELFNLQLRLSGSHDFEAEGLPRSVQYEIAVSDWNRDSPVIHKSLTMAVTIDGKKQRASITMNHNKAQKSFYLVSEQNVTKASAYGVPGSMSIDFRLHDNYDADLTIAYDTNKKSVGFKLDYNGNRRKLLFYFNHNFDVLVNMLGIPKNLGFETQCLIDTARMRSMLKYVYGDLIGKADITSRWHASWDMPSFEVRMTQNVTTDDVFPTSITLDGSVMYNNEGFQTNLATSRGYARLSCNKHNMGASNEVTLELRQNFDATTMPRVSNLQVRYTLSLEEGMGDVNLVLSCNREEKLHSQATAHWNLDEGTASVSASSEQGFVENGVFPTTLELNTNGSISFLRLTAFTSLIRSDGAPFQLSVDAGATLEENSAHLLIKHEQNSWNIPRTFGVDGKYNYNNEGLFVKVDVKRDRKLNVVTGGYDFSTDDDMVYGKVMYTQNFDDFQTIPERGHVSTMLRKTENSLFGQVNVTFGEVEMTHTALVSYTKLAQELSAAFDIRSNNPYLEFINLPHTLAASASANWADRVASSATAQYNDQSFTVSLDSDRETSATMRIRHNFGFKPNELEVSVTGSRASGQAMMEITIDGNTQDIVLTGVMQPGEGNVHLSHGFENVFVPNDISIGGSYRLSPDPHVSAQATVDGTQYSVSGGYEKLPSGFRVTTTLLNGITRTATFGQQLKPGSISFELDHNIPELDNFVPQSLGVYASARMEPRPNITAAIRHEKVTQKFTAEGDPTTLQFALKHNFESLPIPMLFSVKLSGSMEPLQGSIKVDINGQPRTATATLDRDSLLASFAHTFTEIPLPETLTLNIGGSMSPLSGTVRVTIDGATYEVSATLDQEAMRATTHHNTELLDSYNIPRDIEFGMSGSAETLSGEIYLSVDGNFRNIGGSVNRKRRVLSFFHNTELTMPRNITLQITGGMEPPRGRISLTMDKVEREITTEIGARSPFFALTHTVPEFNEYLPTNVRASMEFTTQSAQVSVNYTMSGEVNSVSGSVDFSWNHIRIQASQNLCKGMPAQMSLDLAGSLEFTNFTAMTEFDGKHFNMNGNLLMGTTSEGWYGITTSANTNIKPLRKKLKLPKNMEIELKGRKSGDAYEAATVLNIIRGRNYQAHASITPRYTETTFTLNAEYYHEYNTLRRAVSGLLTASKDNGYSLTITGTQTSPERVNVGLSLSATATTGETIQGRVTFSGQQNIPQLVGTVVPTSIEDGSVTLNLGKRAGDIVFLMNMDGSAFNVRTEYQIQTLSQFRVQFTQTREGLDDDVSLTVNINPMNPRIVLKLQQQELNNLNVPVMNELSYLIREVGSHQIDWSITFTCDGSVAVVGLKGAWRRRHLDWNLYFDNNIPLLVDVQVPTHVASKWESNYTPNEREKALDLACGIEYNANVVWVNITQLISKKHGKATILFSHNVPVMAEYLKFRQYNDTYTYDIVDNVVTVTGRQRKDNTQVGLYTVSYNTVEHDIHYSSTYEDGENEFEYRFVTNEEHDELLVQYDIAGSNMLKIYFNKRNHAFESEFKYALYGPEITSDFTLEKQDSRISLNTATSVVTEGKTYSLHVSHIPVSSEGMKGCNTSSLYTVSDGSSLNINLLGMHDSNANGKMLFNMINDNVLSEVARRTKVVGSYAINGYEVVYTSGQQRVASDLTFTIPVGDFEMEWNFYQNVANPSYPRDFAARIDWNALRWHANVNVDEIDLLLANAQNQDLSLAIRTFAGETLFSLLGNYVKHPTYQLDASLTCPSLSLNIHLTGSYTFTTKNTGNSSITATLEDLHNGQSVHFNLYGRPTSSETLDFYCGMFMLSDFSFAPFSLTSSLNFSSGAQNTFYRGFQAQYNEKQLAAVGTYTPQTFRLSLTQPFSKIARTIILTGSNRTNAAGVWTSSMNVQWGREEDSFGITQIIGGPHLQKEMSVIVDLPFNLIGYRRWEGTVSYDRSTPNVFDLNFQSDLDGILASLVGHYVGDLPQPLGNHDLTVTITQPFWDRIPATFDTRGIMTLSSAGLYESNWRITSKGKDLVKLIKNYRPSPEGYAFDFTWKQAFVPMSGSYIYIANSGSKTANGVAGTASLQVDDMPIISGELNYGSVAEGNAQNTSLVFSARTGNLYRYLLVRNLAVSTWYNYERQGSREIPAFSTTVDVDGLLYHADGKYKVKPVTGDNRFTGDLTIQHPHDLSLFGINLPKSNTGYLKIVVKRKGGSVDFNYGNELMPDKLKVTKQFRYGNGDRILDYSATVKYSPEDQPNDITYGLKVISNDNNYDYTASFNFAHPASDIDGVVTLSGLNSNTATAVATELILKNSDNAERRLWKFAASYGKASNIITITIDSPDIDETELRGDFSQIIQQAGRLINTMAAEATSTGLQFIKGLTETDDGYDMYLGFQYDEEPRHTIHLIVGLNGESAFALLEVKRDFVSQEKLGKVSVNLVNGRLVQVETKTYPLVTNFMRELFSTCDNEILRKINLIADELIDLLESCKVAVGGSETVRQTTSLYIDQAIAQINEIRTTMTDGITAAYNRASNNYDSQYTIIQELLRQAVLATEEAIKKLCGVVARPFSDLVQEHYGSFLSSIGTSLKLRLHIIEELLAKVNADQVFKELIDDAVEKVFSFVLTNGEALFGASRRPLSELIAITESEVIINVPLEFELERFVPLPTLDEIKTWAAQTALALKIDEAIKQLYSYVDKYYQVRAVVYMPHDERLPPFKGHAFVSGFRHFSTFDKRHIDFSSTCPTTHVLATDMRNGNFTVTLSYGDSSSDVIPSIEMIVENRRVAVLRDHTVQYNGGTHDLPFITGKIAVTLEGKIVHIRHLDGDVDVVCDFAAELCTVDVSPYYFGATGGMAGRYNNEPSDDMMSPSLTHVENAEALASEWETSNTICTSGNAYRPCARNNVPSMCNKLFKSDNSPFRSCFPVVDPEPFMKMCVDDMCENPDTTKSCSASAAYSYRCKLAGAPLTMPDHCVVCNDVHGHEFNAAQTKNAEISGVDLVFVLQESACMKRTSKQLRKFLKRMMSGSEGLRDSHYTLVGYGGIDGNVAPHTYTINNQPFTTKKKYIAKPFRSLQLTEAGTESDALEAISYASKLPFRAGAKPMIVLVSCDGCSDQSVASYGDVESQLKKQGISFLHLPHHSITTGTKSVYGYDSRTAFAKHDLDGSVVKPVKSDSCAPLATVTGGSVWDARQLKDPAFRARLSTYISESGSAGTSVTCTCQMNAAGIATSVCTP